MIRIAVPGLHEYEIRHLVLDVNGTLALDGKLIPGVPERLRLLASSVQLHVITANTFGNQEAIDAALGTTAVRISPGHESDQKGRYVRALGAATVAAVGNGENDVDMLMSSAVGIAVLGEEGLASSAHQAADILARGITEALDLLLNPMRITATLRR